MMCSLCLPLVVRPLSLTVRYSFLFVDYWCPLLVVGLLVAVCCILLVVRCLVFGVGGLLFAMVCRLLFVVWCLVLGICYLFVCCL